MLNFFVKPDITFFGEQLSHDFDRCLAKDRFKVDLLLIIGTSLKVSPVSEIICERFLKIIREILLIVFRSS